LEESIALYEESAKLAAFCKQILQQAQQKITELAGDEK
jgi:exodeoxyribonuclease VII small subunit